MKTTFEFWEQFAENMDRAKARHQAWKEYQRLCDAADVTPNRAAFNFGFDAGLVFGCFAPLERSSQKQAA